MNPTSPLSPTNILSPLNPLSPFWVGNQSGVNYSRSSIDSQYEDTKISLDGVEIAYGLTTVLVIIMLITIFKVRSFLTKD